MELIDVEALLQPVSDDAPCGPSLEYDADFIGLENAARRKPETEIGGVVTPAVEPDWRAVEKAAIDLFGRSKDAHIAILMTEALTHNHGLDGFQQGVAFLHSFLERYWDEAHPALDHDDDDGAAVMRMNCLKNLGSRARIGRAIRQAPLVASRAHGTFSLSDAKTIAQQIGEGDAGASERHAAMVDSFQSADVDEQQAIFASAQGCRERLTMFVDLVDERSDVSMDLGVDAIEEIIDEVQDLVGEHLQARGIAPAEAAGDEGPAVDAGAGDGDAADHEVQAGAVNGAPPKPLARGPITSRDDAIKSLDLVCRYFEQHEPSSPVPLLLRRAKGLVAKDFMAILKDLAPDGLSDAERVVGKAAGDVDD